VVEVHHKVPRVHPGLATHGVVSDSALLSREGRRDLEQETRAIRLSFHASSMSLPATTSALGGDTRQVSHDACASV
jgi:hypothetical protein